MSGERRVVNGYPVNELAHTVLGLKPIVTRLSRRGLLSKPLGETGVERSLHTRLAIMRIAGEALPSYMPRLESFDRQFMTQAEYDISVGNLGAQKAFGAERYIEEVIRIQNSN